MSEITGRLARRMHLLLVCVVALFGSGILVFLLGIRLLSADSYSGDMAILALAFTSPFWGLGLIAAIDAYSVLRGRPVKVARAAAWSLLMLLSGILLGHVMGLWYLRAPVNDAGFWLPLIALALGLASMTALLIEWRRRRPRGTSSRPEGAGKAPPNVRTGQAR
ncbi:MAG TPA: hypothetical protein VM305_09130 [Candidatus Limnocylindrales bacterium]|nr:hypothetical protein [Candidatus Limnocylindrales bacterium]